VLLAAGCGPTHGAGPATAAAPRAAHPASHGPTDGHGHGHHGGHGHGHGGPLVHRFERAEDWAPDLDDPARDAWQKPADVIAAMKIEPGMTVVDLGAGTGYFLPHLARAVGPTGAVLALDVEPDMVRHMTERAAREKLANVRARRVPFDDPELAPGSVDRILVVDTWHHISDRGRYAAKLHAALRDSGMVVVVDFTQETRRGPPREHRIRPEQVVAELGAGGMAAEIAAEDLPDQYIVLGRRARP
jgi:predicted methyltransferase